MKTFRKFAVVLTAAAMAAVLPCMSAWAATQTERVSISVKETKEEPGVVWSVEPTENSSHYDIETVEWSREPEDWEPGRKVTLTLTLVAAEGDSFAKKPSASASGMDVVSTTRTDATHVTVKLNYIPKVTLAQPTYLFYEDEFLLVWDRVEYAGGYEVQILRDGKNYKTVKIDGRNTTELDLSKYATDDSLVTVKVRAIAPKDKGSYIKASEWVNFDDEVVSSDWSSTSYGEFVGSGDTLRFRKTYDGNTYAEGWEMINGIWYYFQPGNGYAATNQWLMIDGQWYLFDDESRMLTGWQQRGGAMYYLNDGAAGSGAPYGAMLQGWQNFGGTWYYFTPGSGNAIANAWSLIDNQWYLFDGRCRMLTGWQETGGQRYLLNDGQYGTVPYGAMVTGWATSGPGGEYYWLNDGSVQTIPFGAMLRDADTPDGYHVDANGVWR